ncbi:hypothetical protein ABVT39_009389 [Epinephelus coioides]
MFVLIWATLLFSVRCRSAGTGSFPEGKKNCQQGSYCITLSEGEITAEAGLCVVIPCSFTTDPGFTPQHVVWYKCEPSKPKGGDSDIIFNTNNINKVQSGFKGRVSLLEPDVTQGNCSIIVNDLAESDSGSYQVRVNHFLDGRKDGFTFSARAKVSVKGLTQRPTVMIPPLTEGQQTTLTCTAPGLCSGSVPEITWTWRGAGGKDSHITGNITAFKTENLTAVTQRHSSTLTFNASAKHHDTNVTCKVSFANSISTEETVTLNVSLKGNTATEKMTTPDMTNLLKIFLMAFKMPQVIIAFLIGILLSATICCLARKCDRNKQKNSAETLEMMTIQAFPLINAGHAGENGGAHDQEAAEGGASAPDSNVEPREVEYSAIDFSLLNRSGSRGAEDTQGTTETEYAEIKNKVTEESQHSGGEEGEMLEGNEEKEVTIEEEKETEQCVSAVEEGGEDVAVYSNVNEIMGEM